MIGTRYRFRTVWDLPESPPEDVFSALEQAAAYPSWWPQVRETRTLDSRTGTARFRAALPFDLCVTLTATRRDRSAGVLEAQMRGDLQGWTRWTVSADGRGGTRAVHEQDVDVRKPWLRLLSAPGRPLFRVNHALMMRAGRRGLRSSLRRGLDEA